MPKTGDFGFAYCESIYANGETPWHIRKLTKKGKRLGGGADTKALCGRYVAWDLTKPFDQDEVSKKPDSRCCPQCLVSLQAIERTRTSYEQRTAKSAGPQIEKPNPGAFVVKKSTKKVVRHKKE